MASLGQQASHQLIKSYENFIQETKDSKIKALQKVSILYNNQTSEARGILGKLAIIQNHKEKLKKSVAQFDNKINTNKDPNVALSLTQQREEAYQLYLQYNSDYWGTWNYSKHILENFIKNTLDFERIIDKFLGRETITATALIRGSKSNKVIQVWEYNPDNYPEFELGSHRGVNAFFKQSQEALKKSGAYLQEFKIKNSYDPHSIDALNKAYSEALYRTSRTLHSPPFLLFIWDKQGSYNASTHPDSIYKIVSQGDITEAYLSYLYTKKYKEMSANLEQNLKILAKQVLLVDNMPAIRGADIEAEDNEYFELFSGQKNVTGIAAKGEGARLAGWRQYINLASKLAKADLQNIKKIIEEETSYKKGAIRNKEVIEGTDEIANEEIDLNLQKLLEPLRKLK